MAIPVNPEGSPQGASQASGGVPALVQEVGNGLKKVASLFEQAGAPPEIMDKMNQTVALYGEVISSISGQKPANPSVGSPEAAGNAKPAM